MNELQVYTSVSAMLVQTRSERSCQFGQGIGMYLLATGVPRGAINVLAHAGLSTSYGKIIGDMKKLGLSQLANLRLISKTRAIMFGWDNFNVAYEVAEQRQDSKNAWINATTATLILLHDVNIGDIPLSMNAPRLTGLRLNDFKPHETLPQLKQMQELEAALKWNILDIFIELFPDLRRRFRNEIPPPPAVYQIPVHKTEQYPLPAMKIDESSLEGTIDVIETIMRKTLQMTEEDVKRHGVIFCAGDLLSVSLLDMVSPLQEYRYLDSHLCDANRLHPRDEMTTI